MTPSANQAPDTGYRNGYMMGNVAWEGKMRRIMVLYVAF